MSSAAPTGTQPPALRMVVAVLTYRRPDDLRAVLPALVAQAQGLDGEVDVEVEVEVLVVDNDPEGGARSTAGCSTRVRYVHEPTPGIAAARNRALDEAADADLLVFIDDDERPTRTWLRTLLDTWLRTRPAGVVGPVVSTFATPPDPWIAAGGFFERKRHPTGTSVDVAATNNLLLDLAVVRRLALRFDERLGLTGGSDTMFTRQLTRGGGRLLWCDEALVLDVVPAERATRDWVLRRAYRMGNHSSAVLLLLATTAPERWLRRSQQVGLGVSRLLVGTARRSYGVVRGDIRYQAAGARNHARGAGLISGTLGRVYAEYRRDAP